MPTIRFIRENRDVKCRSGENLREVALREGMELYGLKGNLANCRGAGQCITCLIAIIDPPGRQAVSELTAVERKKLSQRPENWRLACQTLIKSSAIVLTKPQAPPSNANSLIEEAKKTNLPK